MPVIFRKRPDEENDPCCDFELDENINSAWIMVDGIALYIMRERGGVRVDVYRDGEEMDAPMGGMVIPENLQVEYGAAQD